MKKRGLLVLLIALVTLAVSGTEFKAQASAPTTPKTLNFGGKYGHYRRYTKKLPKKIKGNWYSSISTKHHYYERLTFKTYKKITYSRQNKSHKYHIYSLISKPKYGSKLFYNGHWFHVAGITSQSYYRVKKMKIDGKKKTVLLAFTQGTTIYYLRHKTHHIYKTTKLPDHKLMGNG